VSWGACPDSSLFRYFLLGLTFESFKELGVHQFTPQNVVEILGNEFQLNTLLEEFPCVAMGFPFLLPHHPPPCGGIALQIELGKFHNRMLTNLGGMKVIFHFRKPSIHNLSILGPIKVPRLSGLELHTFG
jgi:hypothetical protein